jgi:hypothetical protein
MDTSATVRKAVTEEEKAHLKEQGRCFRCSKQGHISRNCPDRPPKARATTDEGPPPPKDQPPQYDDLKKGETIADYAMKLMDEEREVFLKKVIGDEGASDFQSA